MQPIFRTLVGAALVLVISTLVASGAPLDEDIKVDAAAEEPTPEAQPLPDSSALVVEAIAAFQRGDMEACLESLRSALARDPSLAPPKLFLARMYQSAGRFDRARELLEEVAVEDPEHPDVYLTFAQLALSESHWTEAQIFFDTALALPMPATWSDAQWRQMKLESVLGLAAIAEQRRDWTTAQERLASAVQLSGGDAGLRHRFATNLLRAGREAKAFEQFAVAYQQNPQLNCPEASIGATFVARGDNETGNRWFAKALAAHPDDGPTHFAWATALLYQNKAADAAAALELAAKHGMDTPKLDALRGTVARAQGKHDQALTHLRRAVKRAPHDPESAFQLVLTLAEHPETKNKATALEIARTFAESHPPSATSLAALGIAQRAAGKSDEALQTLAVAVDRADARPEALLALGKLLEQAGKEDEVQQVAARLESQLAVPRIFVERTAANRWIATLRGAD